MLHPEWHLGGIFLEEAMDWSMLNILSGYVKVAIEHGDFPVDNGDFPHL